MSDTAAGGPARAPAPLTTVRGWASSESVRNYANGSGGQITVFRHGSYLHDERNALPVAVVPLSPDGGLTEEIKRVVWDSSDFSRRSYHERAFGVLRAVLGVEEGR